MRQTYRIRSRDKTLELGAHTAIMGVINVTPDSFYDGGRYESALSAVEHSRKLIDQGAHIIDVGGQSTRPGSNAVGVDEELRRVLPVVEEIRSKDPRVWISIDTYNSEVAEACLKAGADMINDVSSFRMDPAMTDVIAKHNVPVVCMHFLKSIHPMPSAPHYENLLEDIVSFFQETISVAQQRGISRENIIIDPGIGFGKNLKHNLEIMRNISRFTALGRPILVGPSNKSFIEKLTGAPKERRLEGTAAAVAVCVMGGAHIVRVHDVAFFSRYCEVLDALIES